MHSATTIFFVAAAAILASLLPAPSHADVYTTFPVQGSTVACNTPTQITWRQGPKPPAFSSLQWIRVDLCTGTNSNQTCPLTLAPQVDPKAGKLSMTVPTNIGPAGPIWFLRYTDNTGVSSWSTRFTLTGANGPMPASGLSGSVPGGPATGASNGAGPDGAAGNNATLTPGLTLNNNSLIPLNNSALLNSTGNLTNSTAASVKVVTGWMALALVGVSVASGGV